jgi:hypothetical protein
LLHTYVRYQLKIRYILPVFDLTSHELYVCTEGGDDTIGPRPQGQDCMNALLKPYKFIIALIKLYTKEHSFFDSTNFRCMNALLKPYKVNIASIHLCTFLYQGDQIWRIFAHWVIVYFWKLTEVGHIFGNTSVKVMY